MKYLGQTETYKRYKSVRKLGRTKQSVGLFENYLDLASLVINMDNIDLGEVVV